MDSGVCTRFKRSMYRKRKLHVAAFILLFVTVSLIVFEFSLSSRNTLHKETPSVSKSTTGKQKVVIQGNEAQKMARLNPQHIKKTNTDQSAGDILKQRTRTNNTMKEPLNSRKTALNRLSGHGNISNSRRQNIPPFVRPTAMKVPPLVRVRPTENIPPARQSAAVKMGRKLEIKNLPKAVQKQERRPNKLREADLSQRMVNKPNDPNRLQKLLPVQKQKQLPVPAKLNVKRLTEKSGATLDRLKMDKYNDLAGKIGLSDDALQRPIVPIKHSKLIAHMSDKSVSTKMENKADLLKSKLNRLRDNRVPV